MMHDTLRYTDNLMHIHFRHINFVHDDVPQLSRSGIQVGLFLEDIMDALAKSADNLASWFSLQLDHVGHPYLQIWWYVSSWKLLAFYKPQEIPPLQNGGASSRLGSEFSWGYRLQGEDGARRDDPRNSWIVAWLAFWIPRFFVCLPWHMG